MNTTAHFSLNFWVQDGRGTDDENHQKEWFDIQIFEGDLMTSELSMISRTLIPVWDILVNVFYYKRFASKRVQPQWST